jgi:hypothetical protein
MFGYLGEMKGNIDKWKCRVHNLELLEVFNIINCIKFVLHFQCSCLWATCQ